MTTISSLGVGSGIDVEGLLTKLMAVESAPLTALTTRKTTYTNQISALGKIQSALATLQDSVKAFSTTSKAYSYSGTLADTSIATATATSDAVAGTYSVEVRQLAATHKLVAGTAASAAAGGTLTIKVGSSASVDVTIAAGATLNDARLAINAANAGVSATIVHGSGGDQLVITSLTSGTAGEMTISSATLTDFTYDPVTHTGGLTQKDAAQDAIVKIDGIQIAGTTSNTVTNALTGVTLKLLKTNIDSPTTLTVSNDNSALQTKLQTFVKSYNDLVGLSKSLTAYNQTTKTAAVLNGDSTVSQVMSQLRTTIFGVPSGASSAYQTLSSLGIQVQSDGTLKLNTDTLSTAMNKDFSSVATTIAAAGTALDTAITSMLDTSGLITTRTNGLNSMIGLLNTRSEAMQRQITATEARYRAQFTALDKMMSQMQVTSTYLTQQLSALNNTSSSK